MARLPLRLRILLFFAALALGGVGVVLAALWLAGARSDVPDLGLVAVVAGFGLLALNAGIWLLFDEHVAKPIQRLSNTMRARTAGAHGAPAEAAQYLGDLGPAAAAMSDALQQGSAQTAARIAAETARLEAERTRFAALLTEIPVATLVCDAQARIVLYDGQAAELLAQQGVPRLGAPLSDYFNAADLRSAMEGVARQGREATRILRGGVQGQSYDVTFKPLDGGAALLTIDAGRHALDPSAARPLVFDFELMGGQLPLNEATPLAELAMTVLDTETTGLLPHRDEIVQIGAIRILRGRVVPGEEIDQLVDPGCPIPEASTAVHRITDAMVAGKPDIAEAGHRLHSFAKDTAIVAHNAPFDMAFLHRHKARMGVDWDNPVLDTVLISAVLYGTTELHTLDALCERLGIEVPQDGRHTGLGDAQVTAQAMLRMIPMLEARGIHTLGALIAESKQHGRLLKDLN